MAFDDRRSGLERAEKALKRLDESERIIKAHRRNDFYAVLRLPSSASQHTIRKHYHKAALRHHPDHNQDDPFAEECFKIVSEVYAILSDPLKRRDYDSKLQPRERPAPRPQPTPTRPPRPSPPRQPREHTAQTPPPPPSPPRSSQQPGFTHWWHTQEEHVRKAMAWGFAIGGIFSLRILFPGAPRLVGIPLAILVGVGGAALARSLARRGMPGFLNLTATVLVAILLASTAAYVTSSIITKATEAAAFPASSGTFFAVFALSLKFIRIRLFPTESKP
jgi:hypothetical protein